MSIHYDRHAFHINFFIFVVINIVLETSAQIETHSNKHGLGGIKQTFKDVGTCIEQCRQSMTCFAVDFDVFDDSCWFHGVQSLCGELQEKETCTHYRLATCFPNTNVHGATPQQGIFDVRVCLATCRGSCMAIDFDSVRRLCWHHRKQTACNRQNVKDNCNHYRVKECNTITDPVPTITNSTSSAFTVITERHLLGATLQTGISDVNICLRGCQRDVCKAVDFDFEDNTCWYHNKDTSCSMLFIKKDCTHFRMTSCSTNDPAKGLEFRNQHALGGMMQPSLTTREACVSACVLSDRCRAIDFNRDQLTCFFHYESTRCSALVSRNCCDHVKLKLCDDMNELPEDNNTMTITTTESNNVMTTEVTTTTDDVTTEMSTESPIVERFCGMPAISPRQQISTEAKIVGGFEAIPHSWPWQVALIMSNFLVCGGSLIDTDWILTAAHCFSGATDPRLWRVRLGEHNLRGPDTSQLDINVLQITTHPSYNTITQDSDIALVRLVEPVSYQREISPVCLPDKSQEFVPGMICTVTGWGETQDPNIEAGRLNQVSVPVVQQTVCNSAEYYGGIITDNMLCAGLKEGGKDTCQGDSGGPLVCNNGQTWAIAGITSFGEGCAVKNRPGVYTRVTQFVDWINDNIKAGRNSQITNKNGNS